MQLATPGLCVVLAACGAAPPVATAPARSAELEFAVLTVGRPSGSAELRVDADGTWHSHLAFDDRGRGPDITATMTFDEHGALRTLHATGHEYFGQPVDETLAANGGGLAWHSPSEHGRSDARGAYYMPLSEPLAAFAQIARACLHAPGRRIALLPAGEIWIDEDRRVEVELADGKHLLHEIALDGLGFGPTTLWLDEHEDMFANVSAWISMIRVGAESLVPKLVADDTALLAERNARLARTLAHHPPAAGLAITHAAVFDPERRALVPDRTVVVAGDRITAVGDAATPIPAGAQVIDAHGRTLLPGLWDMHVHLSDGDGLLDLAAGVTTVRDLGNDIDTLGARVKRFDAGSELGPRVLRAGLIDGPGKYAAPTGVLAANADEAHAAVARYAASGYVQIKIYNSVDPPLVPLIARDAHDRGMRVSGHVPNGMNVMQAVEAGYDEIQHANFLFLQFLAGPDVDTRTPARFQLVASGGAGLDLDRADVRAFLDLLAAHHTVLDPTLTAFEGMFVSDPGEIDPVLAPYESRLPAQVVRGSRSGGLAAPNGTRATYRASFAKMADLVARAWKRGITIVAGTDGTAGLQLSRELELYVQAGIPAPDVLALATLGSARVMHADADSGSIAAGKRADLVVVDGDPTRDISAVRATDLVVCRGIVYDPRELAAAAGMRAR